MKLLRLSLFVTFMLSIGLPMSVAADQFGSNRGLRIETPHEIHEYQQVKYVPNSAWKCRVSDGCTICKNATSVPAIIEVKANYKRADWNIRTDTQEVREHCVNPRQEVWACFSGYIVEPEPGTAPAIAGDPTSCPAH